MLANLLTKKSHNRPLKIIIIQNLNFKCIHNYLAIILISWFQIWFFLFFERFYVKRFWILKYSFGFFKLFFLTELDTFAVLSVKSYPFGIVLFIKYIINVIEATFKLFFKVLYLLRKNKPGVWFRYITDSMKRKVKNFVATEN